MKRLKIPMRNLNDMNKITNEELLEGAQSTMDILVKTTIMLQKLVSKILFEDENYKNDGLGQDFFDKNKDEFGYICESFLNLSYNVAALELRKTIFLERDDDRSKEDLMHRVHSSYQYVREISQELLGKFKDDIEQSLKELLENEPKQAKAFH